MKKIFLFASLLIFSLHANAVINAVGDTYTLADCGSGRGNTSGCETADPHIAFTDVISGPDTGLGDNLGSGMIVTVWGQGLGSTQDNSTIQFCDSAAVCRNAAYVYYWKNADGALPSGPANLYRSHGMQEIAFSIPDSALGAGTIKLTVRGQESNTLPFTTRSGNIYWVAPGGNNANTCSYASPCAFIDGGVAAPGYTGALGNGRLQAGDTLYSRGVAEPGQSGSGKTIGMYFRSVVGTLANQVAVVAYPNTRPFISSPNRGVTQFESSGIVISKYSIEVGYALPSDPVNPGNPSAGNSHVGFRDNGRVIGNLNTQIAGTCFTGWAGSIGSSSGQGSNGKAFGNHIKDLGCDNTSKFAHTMYFSVRDSSASLEAWEIGYNFLDNNNVLYGIHNYDEALSGDCGDLTGTLKIHHNVVFNQRGAGINVATTDNSAPENTCWTADIEIYNNTLINVGQGVANDGAPNADAIRVRGDIVNSNITIENNTIYGYGSTDSLVSFTGSAIEVDMDLSNPTVVVNNNALVQNIVDNDLNWLNTTETFTGSNNSFWNTVESGPRNPPAWTNNVITDPQISLVDVNISLGATSPLLGAGLTPAASRDIYGNPTVDVIGATEE